MTTEITINEDRIKSRIDEIHYFKVPNSSTVVCVMVLKNGSPVVGMHSEVVKSNFNEKTSEQLARLDAQLKIWDLESYLARQKVYEQPRD